MRAVRCAVGVKPVRQRTELGGNREADSPPRILPPINRDVPSATGLGSGQYGESNRRTARVVKRATDLPGLIGR